MHPERGLLLAVREDHSGGGEPVNTIVALDLAGPNAGGGTMLCSGADFYSTPELSDSGRLAWTQWDHPNMPWDSTVIMVGDLAGSAVRETVVVAGGDGESAVQPRWAGANLILLSDRSNWWNLYRWAGESLHPLHATDAEFTFPQWNLGQSPYSVIDDDHLLCTVNRAGDAICGDLDYLQRHAAPGERAGRRGNLAGCQPAGSGRGSDSARPTATGRPARP